MCVIRYILFSTIRLVGEMDTTVFIRDALEGKLKGEEY